MVALVAALAAGGARAQDSQSAGQEGGLSFPPLVSPGETAQPVVQPQTQSQPDTGPAEAPQLTPPAPVLEAPAPADAAPAEAVPAEAVPAEPGGADAVQAAANPDDVDGIYENELCHAQFFDGGTPQAAILHCTRALESGDLSDGDLVTARVNRGIAYKLNGQLELAIEDYTEALKLAPDAGDIYTTRANAFLEMARLDAAISDANKALAFNPDYAPAFFVRGRIFEALGQNEFARDDFLRAYELAPDNADIQEKAWAYGANQN